MQTGRHQQSQTQVLGVKERSIHINAMKYVASDEIDNLRKIRSNHQFSLGILDAKDEKGNTLLSLAEGLQNERIYIFLLETKAMLLLHKAAKEGQAETIENIVEWLRDYREVDLKKTLEARDKNGKTPLQALLTVAKEDDYFPGDSEKCLQFLKAAISLVQAGAQLNPGEELKGMQKLRDNMHIAEAMRKSSDAMSTPAIAPKSVVPMKQALADRLRMIRARVASDASDGSVNEGIRVSA